MNQINKIFDIVLNTCNIDMNIQIKSRSNCINKNPKLT